LAKMLCDHIFLNSVGTYLPPRLPIESSRSSSTPTGNYAYGGYETYTKSDKRAHVMAALAAKQAVEASDHRDEILSPIVYSEVSVPQQHGTPVCHIQRRLKQPESLAFGLEAASDGAMTGIDVVTRILSNGQHVHAGLVTAASWCSDGTDRWSTGGGLPLCDGAAAVVVSKKGGFARLIASHRASEPAFEVLMENKSAQPGVVDVPVYEVGLGPYISTFAQTVSATLGKILAAAKISIEDISYFCPPALPQISQEEIYLNPNGIPIEKTCWSELRKNGHVGPCDQILGIAHLVETGQLISGQFVMLLGGGLGWRITCILLQVV
jgi:3-oxoacyl-[acyl-carrier-protein] synthase-3